MPSPKSTRISSILPPLTREEENSLVRKVHAGDRPSTPGTPPHSRTGALKRGILFGLERKERSVVIGPSAQFVGSSAAAHEFGGRYRRERYPKRPLMGPSLKESVPHLAQMWRDAIK